MRKFGLRHAAIIMTVAGALLYSGPAGNCKAHRNTKAPTDLTIPVPKFSIAVRLSKLAEQRLQSIHESILVIVYFDGDPLPGQGRDNAPFRDVFLGNDERLVNAENIATFDSTKVSQSNWDKLANKDYFITINIISARMAAKNNLLWCGAPEDRLSAYAGKTTDVSCKLIEEAFPLKK